MGDKKKYGILCGVAGWYGVAAIIGAYFMVSFGLLQSNSLFYQILNLTGALGIIAISIYKRQNQTAVLNVFWASIAAIAIVNLLVN